LNARLEHFMKLGIRELFIFILLLGFLGGSYYWGFRRLHAQREFYRADIRQKQEMLTSLSASSASVLNLEAELAELKSTVEVFEKKLPKAKEVDQILSDVWKMGESNHLRAQAVRPLKVDRAGLCSEQPIELTFEGPFTGFYGFLETLEASDRIIRVTDIDLKKIVDAKKPMQAKLMLSIYFEPDKTTASAN
jgi:Tfp pilus assembly protein PilO